MSQLQRIKDVDQLQKMLLAGQMASDALNEVIVNLEAGVSEKQIARQIRLYFVEKGADVSFEPIVAFADHTAIPHHAPSDRTLEKGQMIMIDLGAKLNRYCSDMTRSFFFRQPGDPELGRLWQLTYQAYELACKMLKPGVSCHAIDRKVREFFRKEQVEERFLHSLGHGIGLRVHEFPRIRVDSSVDYLLEVGSVITIEPGLYLPTLGGVRLENTLVITEMGYQELTPYTFDLVV